MKCYGVIQFTMYYPVGGNPWLAEKLEAETMSANRLRKEVDILIIKDPAGNMLYPENPISALKSKLANIYRSALEVHIGHSYWNELSIIKYNNETN